MKIIIPLKYFFIRTFSIIILIIPFLHSFNLSAQCNITIQPQDTTVCIGTSVVLTVVDPFAISYQWQYKNGGPWGNVTNGTPAGSIYTNATSAAMTISGITNSGAYQYRCNITCASSNSTSNTVTLTLNPLPQGSLAANGPFCASGIGTLTWTATSGTGPFIVVYNDGVSNHTKTNVFSGNAFNVAINPVSTTTTYSLISVTDANGCVRSSGFTDPSDIITVNPNPQGSLTANGPFCVTGTGMLTWTATFGTGPYTVVYNDGTSNRTQNSVISGTAFNVFTNPVTTTTTYNLVSVTDANGCVRSNGFTGNSVIISVNPLPLGAGTISGPATVCQGQAGVSYSVPVITNATVYNWIYSGTGYTINGSTNSITITFYASATSGILTVTGTNACGNGTVSANYPILVNPLPSVTASANPTPICKGSSSTLTGGGATTYVWSSGLGSGNPKIVSPNSTMTYVVTGTNLGCSSTASVSVTVNSLPIPKLIDISHNNFILCDTKTLTVKDSSTANSSNFSTLIIYWGDGASSSIPTPFTSTRTHTYSLTGAYTLKYVVTNTNLCKDSILIPVSVISRPGFTITWPIVGYDCDSSHYCVTLTGISSNAAQTIYNFNFGDGYIGNSTQPPLGTDSIKICHTYKTTTCDTTTDINHPYIINVSASILTCSQNSTGGNIAVYKRPHANFLFPIINCISTAVSFTNTSIHGFAFSCDISTNYIWYFGDPSTGDSNTSLLENPTHLYNSTGLYIVTLIADNGTCAADTMYKTICVSPIPISNFTLDKTSGCKPLVITAHGASSTPNVCSDFSYLWHVTFLGSGTCIPSSGTYLPGTDQTTKDATFTFNDPGVYKISYSITNSCGTDTSTKYDTVKAPPIVNINTLLPICAGGTVSPTATFADCYGSIKTYNWLFPGGTPNNSSQQVPPAITYPNNGSTPIAYAISVTETNECGASPSSQTTLTVNPKPVIPNQTSTICSGGTFNVSPTNNIPLGIIVPLGTSYTWTAPVSSPLGAITGGILQTIGQTTISQTLTNTTSSPATETYTVTPTSSPSLGSCVGATFTVTVTVNPTPTATISGTTTVCLNGTAPVITFTNPQNIAVTITYNINSGSNLTINVNASTTATVTAPTGTAGTFVYNLVSVIYQTAPACPNTITGTVTIIVNPTPTVTTQPIGDSLCVGGILPIALSVAYSGGTGTATYQWYSNTINSNTGGTSIPTATNTSYIPPVFNTTGTYYYYCIVTLSGSGCGSASSDVAIIVVLPDPLITMQPLGTQSLCQNAVPMDLAVNATGGVGTYAYQWFSNTVNNTSTGTSIGTATSSSYTPSTATVGTMYYYCVITEVGGPGCGVTSTTAAVIVNTAPTFTTQPLSSNICVGGIPNTLTVAYTNGAGTPVYQWYSNTINSNTGGTAILTATTSSYIPPVTTPGTTYYYCVITLSSGGCANITSNTATVIVNPIPTATISGSVTVCQNAPQPLITFTNPMALAVVITYNINGGTNLQVTVGANSTSTVAVSTNNVGVFIYNLVSVEYQTAPACPNLINGAATVTVIPTPTAFIGIDTTICQFDVSPVITFTNPMALPITVTYNINGGAFLSINITSSSTSSITVPTSTSGIFVYSLISVSYQNPPLGLTYISGTASVTIRPTPIASISGNTTICQYSIPSNIVFTNPQNVAVTITYNINNGPNLTVPVGANSTATVPASTNFAGSFLYNLASITYQSPPYCTNYISGIVTVLVNPTPVITNYADTICSEDSFNIYPNNSLPNNSVPLGTTYTWPTPTNVNVSGLSSGINQTSISDTLVNNTNTPQIVVYTVIPTTSIPCIGNSFNVIITVNPKSTISNLDTNVCSGTTFYVIPVNHPPSSIIPAGTTYTWSPPTMTIGLTGGSANTNQSSISNSLINSTNVPQTATYTVIPKSGNCTGQPFILTVTVYPTPIIPAQFDANCSGIPFSFSPTINVPISIVPTGTTYSWTAPTVTGGVTGGVSGTNQSTIFGTLINPTNVTQTASYTITPTSGSCQGTNFVFIETIYPSPLIPNQTAPIICSGDTFHDSLVNAQPTTIVPVGTTYSWTAPTVTGNVTGGTSGSNQTSIFGTLTNPTNTTQTATYTVIPISGDQGHCIGSSFTVTVIIRPKPTIPNQVVDVCSGSNNNISPVDAQPTTIVPAGTTYSWAIPAVTGGITGGGVGTNATSINVTLTNPTNVPQTAIYNITPTSGQCPGINFSITVIVNPTPLIGAQADTICSGPFLVNPLNNIPPTIPAGTTYSWSMPIATVGITGGASATNQPFISGTLTNSTNVSQTAVYTVTPISPGPCLGPNFFVTIIVNPIPSIPDQVFSVCSGVLDTVPLINFLPFTILPTGTTFSWGVPIVTGGITGGTSGSNQPNISITLVNPTNTPQTATYTVTPSSGTSGNCVGLPFLLTVTVNPTPFIPAQFDAICSGDTFSVSPVNLPTSIVPAVTTYSWTVPIVTGGVTGGVAMTNQSTIFGTLVNPTNVPQYATYTVTPSSGVCIGANFTITVTVNPTPLIPNQDTMICSGTTFSVVPSNIASTTIIPTGTSYTWSTPVINPLGAITGCSAQATGLASISQTLTNITNSTATATYTVTPTSGAAGACIGSPFTVTVTVNPVPFIPPQNTTICSGKSFSITPENSPPTAIVPAGTTYSWIAPTVTGGVTGGLAGTNQSSIFGTLTNPTNVPQTATYTVTPTTTILCLGTSFIVTVTINPSPTASFTYQNDHSTDPFDGTIIFTNTSQNATTYYWDFGDGKNGTLSDLIFSHRYWIDGFIDVLLIASNQYDCVDSLIKQIQIDGMHGLYIPNAFSPTGLDEAVNTFKPIGYGLIEFDIQIYDSWGTLLWESNKIDDHGIPTEEWDGKYKGKDLPADVYVWKATAIFKDNEVWKGMDYDKFKHGTKKRMGTLTLIR